MKTFSEYLIEKSLKKGIMEYKSKNGVIKINYTYDDKAAYFKVPTKEDTNKMSDEIQVKKSKLLKNFNPEQEIFNYLSSIDY